MLNSEYTYTHNGVTYPVVITRKSMKSIRYTFRDGVFYVSAPRFLVSKHSIFNGLEKFADKLIKSDKRSKASGDDFIYLLGTRVLLQNEGVISFNNGESINYKSREDLEKKLKKWFLKYIEVRHRYYEKMMGIDKEYRVKVRKMSTRYGSNSYQTHSICYSLVLMHYTSDVIDSVIVHELAHNKVHDHSKNFYNVVYKYCPNYDLLHKRLRKGEFHD